MYKRIIQATAITFVFHLLMGMSSPQTAGVTQTSLNSPMTPDLGMLSDQFAQLDRL